jgi:diguanylate cyclase (GGDEF)-like protein
MDRLSRFLSMETLIEGGMPNGSQLNLSPRFLVLVGHEPGKVFTIPTGQLTMGRDESCDIIVNDASVSRRHAVIEREPSGIVRIEDRHSRNGIYINDVKSLGSVLRHGDILRVGNVLLKYFESGTLEAEVFQKVFELALHDSVTETLSRTAIMHHLQTFCQNAGETFSVVMADFDHFKQINDTHGHLTGDFVLNRAADAMKRSIRKEDFIGRFGGEEFLMILPRITSKEAAEIAEKCRIALEKMALFRHGNEIHITASFGVTTHRSDELNQPEDLARQLLERADKALYQAKHDGRNRIRIDDAFR